MKTEYRILLIDDDLPSIMTDREDMIDFLEEFGILGNVMEVEAPVDGSVHNVIQPYLEDPDLDLIMVDMNMDGLSGSELIRSIRESNHVYLPVVFYSSSPIGEILDAARRESLDGVYIANRGRLVQKFREIVRSLLAKEHTTKRTRGLLMEGVSEIDATFNEIYQLIWAKADAECRQKMMSFTQKLIEKRAEDSVRRQDGFPGNLGEFETHIQNDFLSAKFDTYTRWRMVCQLLKLTNITPEERAILKDFAKNSVDGEFPSLNQLRNYYAHQTRVELEREHTIEKCINIRKDLRAHTKNISSIINQLTT